MFDESAINELSGLFPDKQMLTKPTFISTIFFQAKTKENITILSVMCVVMCLVKHARLRIERPQFKQ